MFALELGTGFSSFSEYTCSNMSYIEKLVTRQEAQMNINPGVAVLLSLGKQLLQDLGGSRSMVYVFLTLEVNDFGTTARPTSSRAIARGNVPVRTLASRALHTTTGTEHLRWLIGRTNNLSTRSASD